MGFSRSNKGVFVNIKLIKTNSASRLTCDIFYVFNFVFYNAYGAELVAIYIYKFPVISYDICVWNQYLYIY